MEFHKYNISYLTTIIFMIPLIVLPSLILSINIKTSNLETIIKSSEEYSSECYNLTYSFLNNQKTDERYLSLDSYLTSFISVCIVIIVSYSINIIYTAFFSRIFIEDNEDGYNAYILFYVDTLVRIIFFIPSIVCVILLRIRSYTDNCEVFINYYEFCSTNYGENFKDSFSDIMKVKTYTLSVVILFVWEIIYHLIIDLLVYYKSRDLI